MGQASLNAFEEAIGNIKQRRGVVVFAEVATYLANRYAITAVDAVANTVGVDADLSGLPTGTSIPLTNAPTDPNTGTYTVTGVSYASPTTTLTLDESLTGSTVEGYIVDPRFSLYTAGIIKETSMEGEPSEYGPDNQGRTFTKGFDLTGAFTCMQTGAPELQNLPALAEPSGNGLYMAFVDSPFPLENKSSGVQMLDITPEDKIELMNASVNPSFTLDFSREESEIGNEITGYLSVEELENIYLQPLLIG